MSDKTVGLTQVAAYFWYESARDGVNISLREAAELAVDLHAEVGDALLRRYRGPDRSTGEGDER